MEQLKFTLSNLVNILIPAFKVLDQSDIINQNIVLALGNTGCGKSTMLNSLVWGPESLQLETIHEDYEIKQKNSSVKTIKRNTREVINKVSAYQRCGSATN